MEDLHLMTSKNLWICDGQENFPPSLAFFKVAKNARMYFGLRHEVIMVNGVVVETGVCLLFNGNNMDGLVWHVWVVFLEPFDDAVETGAMFLVDSILHPLIICGKNHGLVFCRETAAQDSGSAVINVSLMEEDTPPHCIAAHCRLFGVTS